MAKQKKGWTKERLARFRATMARKREARAVDTRISDGPFTIEPLSPFGAGGAGGRGLVQHQFEALLAKQEVPKRSVRMDFGDFTVTVDWKEK